MQKLESEVLGLIEKNFFLCEMQRIVHSYAESFELISSFDSEYILFNIALEKMKLPYLEVNQKILPLELEIILFGFYQLSKIPSIEIDNNEKAKYIFRTLKDLRINLEKNRIRSLQSYLKRISALASNLSDSDEYQLLLTRLKSELVECALSEEVLISNILSPQNGFGGNLRIFITN